MLRIFQMSEIVLVVLPPGITVKQHGPLVGLATEC